MVHGHFHNIAATAGLLLSGLMTAWLVLRWIRKGVMGRDHPLDILGLVFFVGYGLLVPLNAINVLADKNWTLIFGTEGADTGLVELLTFSQWLLASVLAVVCGLRQPSSARWFWWLSGAVLFWIAGEEVSWGQWLFHWRSEGIFEQENLQHETNLHNFATPAFYDVAYRVMGWAISLGALLVASTRFLEAWSVASAVRRWLLDFPVALPLVGLAATLMQHGAFQELSEAALSAAVVHTMLTVSFARKSSTDYPSGSPIAI